MDKQDSYLTGTNDLGLYKEQSDNYVSINTFSDAGLLEQGPS